jgi:hypothetical protein
VVRLVALVLELALQLHANLDRLEGVRRRHGSAGCDAARDEGAAGTAMSEFVVSEGSRMRAAAPTQLLSTLCLFCCAGFCVDDTSWRAGRNRRCGGGRAQWQPSQTRRSTEGVWRSDCQPAEDMRTKERNSQKIDRRGKKAITTAGR